MLSSRFPWLGSVHLEPSRAEREQRRRRCQISCARRTREEGPARPMLSSRAGLCAPFPYRTYPVPFPSLFHRSIVRSICGRRPTAVSAATTDDLCTPTSHASPPQELFSSTAATVSVPAPVSLRQWSFTDQHLFVLSSIACMTGAAVTGLFLAAIPTLMAFKRSAEALEKLLNVTREELPGTMAALRLSGLEISDLTMELSELGQDISLGVKRSARVVHAAQDGLRRVSSIATMGSNVNSNKGSKARNKDGKESS